MKWGLKGRISIDQILGLLGMYFDAAVVFVTKFSLSEAIQIMFVALNFTWNSQHFLSPVWCTYKNLYDFEEIFKVLWCYFSLLIQCVLCERGRKDIEKSHSTTTYNVRLLYVSLGKWDILLALEQNTEMKPCCFYQTTGPIHVLWFNINLVLSKFVA